MPFQRRQHSYQPKSGGLAVLDAAASRGRHRTDYAALASSEHGPRVKRLANLYHYREGKAGAQVFEKATGSGDVRMGLMHAHDHARKYHKRVKSGIAAHKAIFGGGGAPPV